MHARIVALAATAALLLVGIVTVIAVTGGGSDDHVLHAGFDDVNQLVPGQEVRVAGRKVGEITKVRLAAGRPVVDMDITDKDVWPLPRGTYAQARWGSTTSYLLRYVELIPGPRNAPPLPDGGLLPRVRNRDAFELDQAYRIFRGRTRAQTGQALDGLGQALGGRARQLHAGVTAASGGLDSTATFLGDLGANEEALRVLAQQGDRALGALAAHGSQLTDLVSHAAGTFDELAAQATAQQQSLDRFPGALDQSRTTLARLDTSLQGLTTLVDDLAPGTRPLRRLAASARTALSQLRDVAPLAASTLATGTRTAPALTSLLTTATPFLPRAGQALDGLAPMLACVRPYTPEVASFLETWTGFTSNYDAVGHYARSFPLKIFGGLVPGTRNTSADAVKLESQLRYAMPRPPGLNGGKPWFQPQCGAGPSSLDPSKDPEGKGR